MAEHSETQTGRRDWSTPAGVAGGLGAPAISRRVPATDLRPCVELFWSIINDGRQGRFFYEVFPDSHVQLVFRFSAQAQRMVVLGPMTEKATVEIDLASDYFGVRFHPGRMPNIADIKEADLVDCSLDITTFGGRPIAALATRLLALREHDKRQHIMEESIRCFLPATGDERCLKAAAMIDDRGGQVRIAALAAHLDIHVRTLERLFQNELGVSPKTMARHVRLRRVMTCLHAGGYGTLADLAHACGYADQAHMIREFKELTGMRPGDRTAREPHPIEGEPATRIVHRFRP